MNNNYNRNSPQTQVFRGMSNLAWGWTLTALEWIISIIKSFTVVGGVLAANLADVIMGGIAITLLFGGFQSNQFGTPSWVIGFILSMGASAPQIFLWTMLQKRNIGLKDLAPRKFKNLDKDVKGFLITAGIIWVIDTFMDVSPIFLLSQNSAYKEINWLFYTMMVFVGLLVFVLCGFAEILTSNLRGMLEVDIPVRSNNTQSTYQPVSRQQTPSNRPDQRGSNNASRRTSPTPRATSVPVSNPTYHPVSTYSRPSQNSSSESMREFLGNEFTTEITELRD